MKFLDLSYDIDNDIPVYPGDSNVRLDEMANMEDDGFTAISYCGTMHAGTHLDGPKHMTGSEKYICDYSLDNFVGKGVLLNVKGEKEITLKEDYYKLIKENNIVLFYTGFNSKYGQKDYYENHPIISKELAEFLVVKKVRMIGMDMPSPDRNPYEIHKLLLENNIFILENLNNLEKLIYEEDFSVFAQPLKIKADSSLVRAIAVYQGY